MRVWLGIAILCIAIGLYFQWRNYNDSFCPKCGYKLDYDFHGFDQRFGHCHNPRCGNCDKPNCTKPEVVYYDKTKEE